MEVNSMKIRTIVAPVLFPALLAAACGGGANASKPGSSANATTQNATASQAVAPATGAEFGVPECDRYLQKYMACVDSKVPEMARAAMRQSFDQTKVQWKQAAATEQGRTGLAAACTQAEATAKQAMAAYGCSW
jgi:hypothetical protein